MALPLTLPLRPVSLGRAVRRRTGAATGSAAALVLAPPPEERSPHIEEVRIAFDGDAVLFDAESENVYRTQGLEAFQQREAVLADRPMNPGPFEPFLMGLKRIQDHFPEEASPIRLSLITARGVPAHKRVINTLRHWGVRIDETFFLGGFEKAGILQALQPHIYFDDQLVHLEQTKLSTPAAQVVPVEEQLQLDLGRHTPVSEEAPAVATRTEDLEGRTDVGDSQRGVA